MPPPPVPVPVPVPVPGLAAATSDGEASCGLATRILVLAASVIAISCLRSVSSRAIVWLPGTASTAWATLKAPDPGWNTAAPTATPMTTTAAKTAIGKTMPTRRIRPRLRLLLRFPVRCRDKAILSFGHARLTPDAACNEAVAFRARAHVVTGAARRPAAPDLVRRLARLAQVPLALHDARKTTRMRSTWLRKPAAGLPEDL